MATTRPASNGWDQPAPDQRDRPPNALPISLPQKMIDRGEHIGMRIKMQETDLLAAGQRTIAKCLDNPARDRVIATNRHRPRPGNINRSVEIDLLDAVLIVIGPWKRHIAGINNAGTGPGIKTEPPMRPALQRRIAPARGQDADPARWCIAG